MTTPIIVLVIIAVVIAVAAFLIIRKKNREANVARAEQLRSQAATHAQTTIAPAQERAAAAEAQAAQVRAAADRAEAEAAEARRAAQQVEATHEGQVRAADRIDPRVDHKADDYAPQVVEQPATTQDAGDGQPPLLPRRTPGANEMPGKPIEQTDSGGGWFTKGSTESSTKDTDRS